MPPPPSASGSPPGSEEPPAPAELPATSPSWPGLGFGQVGLDRLDLTQAIGGLALGLIALFSSYDHLTIAGRNIPIPQQWGIPLIAASVAIIVVDAQLATGSRLRAEDVALRAAEDAARAVDERQSDRDRAEQRENEADRERNRAAEARGRQAEADERQRESLERLHQAAVLSARVQLNPSNINRARLQTFLALLNQTPNEDSDR